MPMKSAYLNSASAPRSMVTVRPSSSLLVTSAGGFADRQCEPVIGKGDDQIEPQAAQPESRKEHQAESEEKRLLRDRKLPDQEIRRNEHRQNYDEGVFSEQHSLRCGGVARGIGVA